MDKWTRRGRLVRVGRGDCLRRGLRKAVKTAGTGPGALVAAALAGVAFIALTCPPVESLRDYKPPQASLVLDHEGKLLARLAPEERIVVPLSAVSPKLVGAFVAVEDERFFQHYGAGRARR